MKNRPQIEVYITWSDRILEIICGLLLFLQWIYIIHYYPLLPDTIPTHFNARGEADGFGTKGSLFTLPTIGTILYLLLTILNRYPHKFNYLAEITAENAHAHYRLSTKMMRWMKLFILLIFSIILFSTVQSTLQLDSQIGWWFLPFFIFSNVLIMIVYFLKASKIE